MGSSHDFQYKPLDRFRRSPQLNIPCEEKMLIDLFCGGGGGSTGIEQAVGRPVDKAINHDKVAISMHMVNHPSSEHYNSSVWDVCPKLVAGSRKVGVVFFSPDCRHFSRAKGGKPVEKNIRALPYIGLKWAVHTKPDVLICECVPEIRTWGPLDKQGKMIPELKGTIFDRWVVRFKRAGYSVEHRILKCMDYGIPTTRERFFMICRKDGQAAVWPDATHGPKGSGLKPYLSAAEHVIDWRVPGKSLFGRKKPLADNTLRRIAKGIKKFVVDNPRPFIVRLGQTGWAGDGQQYSIDKPITTITTKAEHCLVIPQLRKVSDSESEELIAAFVNSHKDKAVDGSEKRPAGDRSSDSLQACHLIKLRGTNIGSDINTPLHTVSAQGLHHGLIQTEMFKLDNDLDSHVGEHVEELQAFLIKFYGTHQSGCDIGNPLDTVTTKERFGLVTVYGNLYQIVDIKFRMLQPHELYAAHGFPKDYQISIDADGNKIPKYQQVAKVGNSVPPRMAKVLVGANYVDEYKMAA